MTTQFEIIRPANTTAYAANDVINSNASTSMVSVTGTAGYKTVLGGTIISSNPASTPTIHAHCFKTSFTIAADNSAFGPSDASAKANYLGTIVFDTWYAFTSNKVSHGKPLAPFTFPDGPVYIVLVAGGAYTPISAEVLTGQLDVTL